jgi:hypothetical protein
MHAFGSIFDSHVSASRHRLTTTKFLPPDVPEGGRCCWPKPDSIDIGELLARQSLDQPGGVVWDQLSAAGIVKISI